MAPRRAYLDWNASAPLLAEAREAMLRALDFVGNPSSVHGEGRALRVLVDEARREVAALVGARADHVVFTSGASEAAATLLTPEWRLGRAPLRLSRLYVSAADHPCLLNGGRFERSQMDLVGVDANGVVRLDELRALLAAHDRSEGLPLVAIHAANNETGVVQPVAGIAAAVKAAGGVFVCDAVQAAGRIPIDISAGYADFIILSSHKIGGPQGVGAIAGNSDLMMPVPLVAGGGQEKGHRGGTENVAGIAGFGAAARVAAAGLGQAELLREKRDRIERAVLDLAPGATIFGKDADRLPNTTCFAVPGLKSETAQIAFDLAGVALSSGSACSSGKVGPSHVLKAMGFGEEASALRVSIGRETDDEAVEIFRAALASIMSRQTPRARVA